MSALSRKVIQDANDLVDYATLEYTAASQIASMKRKIRELTSLVKEERQTITDLERQIGEQRKLAEEEAGKQKPEEPDDGGGIDYIVELELQLKELYAERAQLIQASRK
jgi:uncharacterized protein involved in exopolysaccharide biosynthesis